MSILAGSMSIAPRLKQAFENAQRDADRRKRAMIDPAALLLGMVEVEDAMSNRILHNVGVDPQQLRHSLRPPGG
jgi:ATP-dependent Clp protease ATP-binding subunit ClpA